jgi:hypothetical protein
VHPPPAQTDIAELKSFLEHFGISCPSRKGDLRDLAVIKDIEGRPR